MTKPIDPSYVLDEVEILGLLVERIAEHSGLLRHGESIQGVRLHPENSARHVAGLFAELRERRETRHRVRSTAPYPRHAPHDPFIEMEWLLDVLRTLPTTDNMRSILIAHSIEQHAKATEIEKQLTHTAVSAGPRGVKLPMHHVTADGVTKRIDELTSEEHEEYLDSWGPRLPPDVLTKWRLAIAAIKNQYSSMEEYAVVRAYEEYLQWVLDSYATGASGGVFGMAAYNEVDRAATEERVLMTVYKDTFWRRSAKIVENPEYDSSKPSYAVGQRIQAPDDPNDPKFAGLPSRWVTIEHPVNPRYLIAIEFEPRLITEMPGAVSLYDLRTSALPEAVHEVVGEIKEGYDFIAVHDRSWDAHPRDAENLRVVVGKTKLEAYTRLAAEPRSLPNGRSMTDEERRSLTLIGTLGLSGTPKKEPEPEEPAGTSERIADIIRLLSDVPADRLESIYSSIVMQVKENR
jgi:hypothetical protein